VGVKTATDDPGYLQAKPTKKVDACDIYILVHADFPNFEILGGALSRHLISRANLNDYGYGTCYMLEQSQLTPLELLFA